MRTTIWIGLAALGVASPLSAASFYGLAQSIDGDSLRVGDREVRLFGIDAPEFDQSCKRSGQDWSCGQDAAERLSQLVTGKDVRCVEMGTDQYHRTLARCTVGAIEINRTMVATGYAVAFRRYSMDYVSAEDSAKASKRGLWAGSFQMPWQYRGETNPAPRSVPPSNRRGPAIVRPPSSGACNIKGNRNRRGEWIYHVPGRPGYAETRAEQMFCTEAEAQAAGYRKSRAH
jgi:endonuclease YncB( thermonuclease family)